MVVFAFLAIRHFVYMKPSLLALSDSFFYRTRRSKILITA